MVFNVGTKDSQHMIMTMYTAIRCAIGW